MISRLPADVVCPGELQKRPNSRWSDGESKTGFSLSSPGRELVFQPTLPRRVSQFSIPWILTRASARLPSVQNGHRESHRYGSFCLARLNSHDGEERESRIEKSPIPLKVERISGARCDFHPSHVTAPKRSARREFWMLAPCRRKRPDHQQPIWKLTLVDITSLYPGVLLLFFLASLCPVRDSGLLYFSLRSPTILILRDQVRRAVNQAHRHPISPADSITSQLPSN